MSRRHGISRKTIRRWRANYRGMTLADARRFKRLDEENRRLTKLVANLSLDNALLTDVVGREW